MRENATFRDGEPFFSNACVGNNGSPNYYHYAKGYSSAANLLIEQTLKPESTYPVDTFVYPICFNMRHSIELRLKGAIEKLTNIYGHRKNLPSFSLEGSHDIGKIWQYFKLNAVSLDNRIELYTRLLGDTIDDFAEIDPTGQTFRYPYSTDKSKHLTTLSSINISILSERFKFIESILDSLEAYIDELETECAWKTHTSRLSRADILAIATKLPPKSTWGNTEFKKLKEEIKKEYGIGSAGFNDAIGIISKTFRTNRSGIPSPKLIHLEHNDIERILYLWQKINKEKDDQETNTGSSNQDFERLLRSEENFRVHNDEFSKLLDNLDRKKIADLLALFEASSQNYPEAYPYLFNHYERQLHSRSELTRELRKILLRRNLIERLLRFHYLIGHHEAADLLITSFNLKNIFPWIKDAQAEKYIAVPCQSILADCIVIFGKGYIESKYPNYPGTKRNKVPKSTTKN
ncbi:hypothetical protein K3F44_23230 [Pseudomonas sp. S07E 245]|uniref:hypothetical protein n=1 Tax=Pseudomonas sp. S07E 245 TaxID=2866278 RepID=UPI001C7393DC|nr:hypothetical protein [Pseudomonas sp. S07E 245]QYX52477.1 hypothetical protein K3F44_23230 [Pseudomonas sp. S07E 245]